MDTRQITKLCLSLLLLVVTSSQAHADVTYQDPGPYGVDKGRIGSLPIAHYHDWKVEYKNVSRLCITKQIVSINGLFPGPPIYIREGDVVVIKVTNNVQRNITLHWHGVKQMLQNWQDGPAYVTQCPIRPEDSFTYTFTVLHQRGTAWWHAHITWMRATLHGALVILPKKGVPYPFSPPDQERVLIMGEWWNSDTEAIEEEAILRGAYNSSDALTLDGQPGDLYNCSSQDTTVVKVEAGKTYLLRLINAAMNFQLFFSIAGHAMVVVEADGDYTKPLNSSVVLLTPGQSLNVLVTASNVDGGRFYIAAMVWSPAPMGLLPYPTIPATGILEYLKPWRGGSKSTISPLPRFPAANDSNWALQFFQKIRSLASQEYPIQVPIKIHQDLLFTVGYNLLPCKPQDGCGFLNGTFRIVTTVNNITFVAPRISLLQAYSEKIDNVYSPDFPDQPPFVFNFTGAVPPANLIGEAGTRVSVLEFNDNVQLVFQNTDLLLFESHPFHLHGFSFFIVGSGFGTYNATEDPKHFNLKDPPLRNTASIPAGGWAAIRWKANNPGVWFMHCHLEIHTTWGMSMAFIVKNGKGPLQTLPPSPPGLPKC